VAENSPDVIDLRFPLSGGALSRDYADALWMALRAAAAWLEDDPLAGVHPIDGLSPAQGGWYVSGRTRLTLRIASGQVAAAKAALEGQILQIGPHHVELGVASVREIVNSSVLYSKFVAVCPASSDGRLVAEDVFLAGCQEEFDRLGIRPTLVCGKAQQARTPAGLLSGFSLMLSALEPAMVQRLQREGLGVERKRGCGIFIPHKSGAAVGTIE
jgi:CRISPR-associated protein Cas6